jgi:N-acetyl-anhydromuramyl-L-alanine amidase AmpD
MSKKQTKIVLLLTSIFFLGCLFSLTTAVSAQTTIDEVLEMTKKPVTKINIPGVSFSDIKAVEEGDKTFIYIPFLGEYIAAIYKYAVVVMSILAVVMIILSGLRWTLSGGDQGRIGEAQKGIGGAVIGLLLAVGSYSILYTVNPELVAFKSLKIEFIEKSEVAQEMDSRAEAFANNGINTPGVSGSSAGVLKTNIAEYQSPLADNSWCNVKNPSKNKNNLAGVRHDFFNSLDCIKADRYRPTTQIESIVLHDGYRERKENAQKRIWLDNMSKKYNKPRVEHYSLYVQLQDWRTRKIDTTGKSGQPGASSHYTIERDGTIYQTADELSVTWHAFGQNKRGIGIDLIYINQSPRYTLAQYISLARLVKDISDRYPNIKEISDKTMYGHGDCADNKVDPWKFDYEKLGALIPGASFSNEKHEGSRVNMKTLSDFCVYVWKDKKTQKGPAYGK